MKKLRRNCRNNNWNICGTKLTGILPTSIKFGIAFLVSDLMQWDDGNGEQDKWFEESITVFTELFLDESKMKVCVNITGVPNVIFCFVICCL